MKKLLYALPVLLLSAFLTAGFSSGFSLPVMRAVGLIAVIAAAACLAVTVKRGGASPIAWTMSAYLALGAAAFWLWPAGPGRLLAAYPLPALYLLLLITAAAPQMMGLEPFTTFFAKRRTPEAVQATDIFKRINLHMSWGWAAIFAACLLSSLVPNAFPGMFSSRATPFIFTTVIPLALNLGLGLPFTAKYPNYYQRKMGIQPEGFDPDGLNRVGPQGQAPKEGVMSPEQSQRTGAHLAKNCRELLAMMPTAFKAEAAGDMNACVQFKVTGEEEFNAYLEIADGKCVHHEGEAAQPDLLIETPGQVWLDISQGRMDGQEAFFKGLYKVNGDLAVLMKFRQIFPA